MMLPMVTGKRLFQTKFSMEITLSSFPLEEISVNIPIGMKYMLATQCSMPVATNAVIGKTIARTLSATLRALKQSQIANQTNKLQPIPAAMA